MKTNQLPDMIAELRIQAPAQPTHQALLRKVLVAAHGSVKPSFSQRALTTLFFTRGTMSHISPFKVAMAAVMVTALTASSVYSVRHTPHALAEQTLVRSIAVAHTLSVEEISKMRAQFDGTPAESLEEARKAKDLKIISKEEFDAFFSNVGNGGSISIDAAGGGMVNLAGIGVSEGAGLGMTGYATTTAASAGGAPGSGAVFTVSSTASAPEFIPDGALMAAGTMAVHGEQGILTPAALGGTISMMGEGAGASTGMVIGAAPVFIGANGATITTMAPAMVSPSKYLRYTDANGNAVAIGLTDDDKPIMRVTKMAGGR